ncbi:restriction endonuclease subunit S [Synechococcus sp. CBW1107]|uniref:restriction endonuclease subunit S n=1 Tax=Synechococcus sp. CBW1107 TaxID=2789857 RepID=UPI0018CFA6D8|nr:restriction endonuclease subunit S [Synechococcus sp. CBW1107]QPN56600.1 restriction endonuclease subunit S [Synechococcus sp. CBW1107]
MELKSGYKQTEVGMIPEDWDALELEAVCTMKSGEGITASSIDDFSEYPCYGGNGLRGYTKRFTHDGRFALIGRQGALCGNVVSAQSKFFASEHAVVVTPRASYDIDYLTYVLGEMHLNRYSESSAQPGLSVSKLLKLPLAAPRSEAEQRSIALALSNMDALLGELGNLIAKRRGIKQAAMQELLTGKRRLPGFEGEWGVKTLRQVAMIRSGITKNSGTKIQNPVKVNYLRVANVQDGFFDLSEISKIEIPRHEVAKYSVLAGDVLMNEGGDLDKLGRGAVWQGLGEPCVHQNHVFVVRPDPSLSSSYLNSWITSSIARDYFLIAGKQTTNLASISKSSLGELPIHLPSLEEQEAITDILDTMDSEIRRLEERHTKTIALKQGMMQQLLTGKIRLQ